jgi:hypothetical protein
MKFSDLPFSEQKRLWSQEQRNADQGIAVSNENFRPVYPDSSRPDFEKDFTPRPNNSLLSEFDDFTQRPSDITALNAAVIEPSNINITEEPTYPDDFAVYRFDEQVGLDPR